jgi:CBS-domain-containing membrane protein
VIQEMLQGLFVSDLMNRDVRSVPAAMPAGEAAPYLFANQGSFLVVDGQGRVLGTVGLDELQGADPAAPVGHVMSRHVPTIPDTADALAAFRVMGQAEAPRLIVTDATGGMIGILTRADLQRAIQARSMGFQVASSSSPPNQPPTPVTVTRVAPSTPFSPSPPVGGFGYTRDHAARRP